MDTWVGAGPRYVVMMTMKTVKVSEKVELDAG